MFKCMMTLVILASLASASPASARCRDGRKTCDYTRICTFFKKDAVISGIEKSVTEGDGNGVWVQLRKCEIAGQTWYDADGNRRTFNDISAGCTDPEYVVIGKWGLQSMRDYNEGNAANSQACNQLPQ